MTDNPTDRYAPGGDPDFLEAAKRRKKMPLWAVPIFPLLLVWGLIYVNSVTNPPAANNTPDAMGASIYAASCASCHGATGGGGAGPAFAGGDLLKVFTKWQEQVQWVDVGKANWTKVTGSTTFGDTKKPLAALMPGFGPLGDNKSLTCPEIVLVVRYEREHFAGAPPDPDLETMATAIAAGTPVTDIPNCKP